MDSRLDRRSDSSKGGEYPWHAAFSSALLALTLVPSFLASHRRGVTFVCAIHIIFLGSVGDFLVSRIAELVTSCSHDFAVEVSSRIYKLWQYAVVILTP